MAVMGGRFTNTQRHLVIEVDPSTLPMHRAPGAGMPPLCLRLVITSTASSPVQKILA